MDYDTVVSAAFQPSAPGVQAAPTEHASPARRLRDAIEPIAMHPVWSRPVNERLARHGLDFLGAYVWGRAAALGEPDAGVVVASFAVFEPGLVRATYAEARQACPRDTLLADRTESTVASLEAVLAGEDVSAVADALHAAVTAADGTGRPLFSGLSSQPWPTTAVGRLWRACELARERRGDSHVAAWISRNVGPLEMNILTELWVGMPLGAYTATRGWSPAAIQGAVTALQDSGLLEGTGLSDKGRSFREEIEASTDAMEQPLVEALGANFEATVHQLNGWSDRCIAAGAFPPDVFKRAAG